MIWFHKEDFILLRPTSKLEFDLELLGENSRAPKFSSSMDLDTPKPGAHLCFLGGGYMSGYELVNYVNLRGKS